MIEGYTLEELERRLGYRFKERSLLKRALTHSSFMNEQRSIRTETMNVWNFWGMQFWNW